MYIYTSYSIVNQASFDVDIFYITGMNRGGGGGKCWGAGGGRGGGGGGGSRRW